MGPFHGPVAQTETSVF